MCDNGYRDRQRFVGHNPQGRYCHDGRDQLERQSATCWWNQGKLLAAHRHGIRELIIPKDNERDIGKLDEAVRNELQIHLADHVDDVLKLMLPKLGLGGYQT